MESSLQALCRRMQELGVDGYWVSSPVNVRYLSGFTGEDSTLVAGADGSSFLITDSRFMEQARREADVEELICREGSMTDAVKQVCHDAGISSLGLTSPRVSYYEWSKLNEATGLRLKALDRGLPEELRVSKSAAEIAAIRRSVEVNEQAFRRWQNWLEPGQTEEMAAARLEYEQRLDGAEGRAFETICASGPHASMPHAGAGSAELQEGSALLVDWGAEVDGYCSDLTRTLSVGRMPQKTGELIQIAIEAQQAALDKIQPGVPAADVDRAARDVIVEHGYEENIAHSVGHGVGLEVHEAPRLSVKSSTELSPGMVVTVEPGIYIEGEAGARVEDMVAVTRDGYSRLSSLDRELPEMS
ncbi:MAG: Xaa-Pro peptidase family protein [Planctomycetota bacterium]